MKACERMYPQCRQGGVTKVLCATAVVVAATLLNGCGGGRPATSSRSNCATRAGAQSASYEGSVRATSRIVQVEARDFAFSPTCITDVMPGTVTLVVHNTGAQLHNVRITSQHIDRDVRPGATASVVVHMRSAPVVFVCKYHRGLGMSGALIPASTSSTGHVGAS